MGCNAETGTVKQLLVLSYKLNVDKKCAIQISVICIAHFLLIYPYL